MNSTCIATSFKLLRTKHLCMWETAGANVNYPLSAECSYSVCVGRLYRVGNRFSCLKPFFPSIVQRLSNSNYRKFHLLLNTRTCSRSSRTLLVKTSSDTFFAFNSVEVALYPRPSVFRATPKNSRGESRNAIRFFREGFIRSVQS